MSVVRSTSPVVGLLSCKLRHSHEVSHTNGGPIVRWDYFISHASEDKRLVAAPLAHYFQSVGFSVWYDDFSLSVGDSILAGINRGLAESTYGIVILSPAFFQKSWPQRELAALMGTDTRRKRRILPIWHQIDAARIAQAAPLLADIKAVSTSRGLNFVVEEIVRASYPKRVESLPASNVPLERAVDLNEAQLTLKELLLNGASRDDIFLLISAYQVLLSHLGYQAPLIIPAARIRSTIPFDFAMIAPHGVTGPVSLTFVLLGPTYDDGSTIPLLESIDRACGSEISFTQRPHNDYLRGRRVGEFPAVLHAAEQIKGMVTSNNLHYERPELWNFSALLIYGRRKIGSVTKQDDAARTSIRIQVEIASYDRLADGNVTQLIC
jgi:TIR domain